MLRLDGVVAGYGPTVCLKGISLEVRDGEVVALIGANGAGKTTTLMTISGLVRLREGTITFDGERLDRLRPEQIAARGLGHVPEGRRIFPRLTVLENLRLGAYLRTDRAGLESDFRMIWELFPILRDRAAQLAGTLSGGEQQMLAMARGLMGKPRLLLLDEPSLGLAPKIAQVIAEVIGRIHQRGTSVLLVEQNAQMALAISHRGYVLETGSLVMADTAQALASSPQVKAAYLGG